MTRISPKYARPNICKLQLLVMTFDMVSLYNIHKSLMKIHRVGILPLFVTFDIDLFRRDSFVTFDDNKLNELGSIMFK